MKAFSVGLPGAMECRATPTWPCQRRIARLVSAVPLSLTMVVGSAREGASPRPAHGRPARPRSTCQRRGPGTRACGRRSPPGSESAVRDRRRPRGNPGSTARWGQPARPSAPWSRWPAQHAPPPSDGEALLLVEAPQLLAVRHDALALEHQPDAPVRRSGGARSRSRASAPAPWGSPARALASRSSDRRSTPGRPDAGRGRTSPSRPAPPSAAPGASSALSRARSSSTALSSIWSASSLLSRAFSSSRLLSRLASETRIPPYFAFHLQSVVSLTP